MSIKIEFATLDECDQATGIVVVIDVLRAFTTAACAFGHGAKEVLLVGTVEEALELKKQFAGSRIMGEVGTLAIPEFDYGNSSAQIDDLVDLQGRTLIHRTSAGTQGVVKSTKADLLLAASFVCAGATARYILKQQSSHVIFIITGIFPDRDGDEDRTCADYIAELIKGNTPDVEPYLKRAWNSDCGLWFHDPDHRDYPRRDLEIATHVDRFDFAMPIKRQDGKLIMRPATT